MNAQWAGELSHRTSDVNKLPTRTLIYALISHYEQLLAAYFRRAAGQS